MIEDARLYPELPLPFPDCLRDELNLGPTTSPPEGCEATYPPIPIPGPKLQPDRVDGAVGPDRPFGAPFIPGPEEFLIFLPLFAGPFVVLFTQGRPVFRELTLPFEGLDTSYTGSGGGLGYGGTIWPGDG